MPVDDALDLIERLKRHLTPVGLHETLMTGGHRVGAKMEEYARMYPPDPAGRPLPSAYTLDGKPSKFVSHKQRRYVMAMLRQGKLKSRRSGKLGGSITHLVEVSQDYKVTVRAGTNVAYGPYVLDLDRARGGKQNPYHTETGWQHLPDIPTQHGDELVIIFVGVLKENLLKAIKGGS